MAAVASQSLYRKYRPQKFGELVGQEHVTTALRNAVRDHRVGHAYLFSGPRGTGKTTMARLLAKALNCTHPDGLGEDLARDHRFTFAVGTLRTARRSDARDSSACSPVGATRR